MHAPDPHGLIFPFPEPPAPGQLIKVAPGIFWARIALPFRLDHVNIYLIEDGDGFAVIDTGIGDEATKQAWLALMAGALAGKRLTRLFVTHFHPDHIGLAGWLCERFGTPLGSSCDGSDVTSCANGFCVESRCCPTAAPCGTPMKAVWCGCL